MFLRNGLPRQLIMWLALGFDFHKTYMSYSAARQAAYFGTYKKASAYRAVSRLLSVGDIEKVIKNGQAYIRLTSQGDNKLKQDIPFFKFSQKDWDGYWRTVIFDINEKDRKTRDSLRWKLKSFGFRQWQKSVYISPFSIEKEMRQFIAGNNLANYCYCLQAKKIGGESDRLIATKVFGLKELGEEYWTISSKIEKAMTALSKKKVNKTTISTTVEEYFALILKDPGLPKQLLPSDWPGTSVRRSFSRFQKNLSKQNLKIIAT
jgi:phenylacetic acid degradation operon negative regulatory protein